MNFSGYKKVKEDEKIAVLKHHDGHEIRIAKKALSYPMRKKLSALPLHMKRGGRIPGLEIDLEESSSRDPVLEIDRYEEAPRSSRMEDERREHEPEIREVRQEIIPSESSISGPYDVVTQSQNDPNKSFLIQEGQREPEPQVLSSISGPYDVVKQGQNQNTQESQKGPSESFMKDYYGTGNQNNHVQQMQPQIDINQMVARKEEVLKTLVGEWKHLQDSYHNYKIDPEAYMKKMNLGDKILMNIGMIISGGGAAMAGIESTAVKMIENRIKQNIAAQESELGKRKNMLDDYVKFIGNLPAAKEMLGAMQLASVSEYMKGKANQIQDPQKKQRALELSGKVDQEVHGMLQGIAVKEVEQLAKAQQQMQQMQSMDPNGIYAKVPKEHQKEAFKEAEENEKIIKANNYILRKMDEINELNTIGRRTLEPFQVKSRLNAAQTALASILSRELANKFTEFEFHKMQDLFSSLTDDPESYQFKRDQVEELIKMKLGGSRLKEFNVKSNFPQYRRPHKK